MTARDRRRLLAAALAVLAGILSTAAAAAANPRSAEDEIRQRLRDVYARPEFGGAGRQDWSKALLRWLRGLFEWLGGLNDTAPALFWLILLGCVVALALIGWHVAWTVRKLFFVAPGGSAAGAAAERERLSRTYLAEARRRAADADFTEAIRYLFLSLVYRYDEKGRVGFQRAYTNREYLVFFHDRPAVRSGLAEFVDALDDYWYAQRPAGRAEYDRCLALYEQLR